MWWKEETFPKMPKREPTLSLKIPLLLKGRSINAMYFGIFKSVHENPSKRINIRTIAIVSICVRSMNQYAKISHLKSIIIGAVAQTVTRTSSQIRGVNGRITAKYWGIYEGRYDSFEDTSEKTQWRKVNNKCELWMDESQPSIEASIRRDVRTHLKDTVEKNHVNRQIMPWHGQILRHLSGRKNYLSFIVSFMIMLLIMLWRTFLRKKVANLLWGRDNEASPKRNRLFWCNCCVSSNLSIWYGLVISIIWIRPKEIFQLFPNLKDL